MYYPYIADYSYWTITDTPGEGNKGMTVSDENAVIHLTAVKYPEDLYNEIYEQSEKYCLVEDNVTLNYNNVDRSESHSTTYINRDGIVVKDNKFVGALTFCYYRYEVHLHTVESESYKGILFADGRKTGINYSVFEGQPGGFKWKTEYSIELKAE